MEGEKLVIFKSIVGISIYEDIEEEWRMEGFEMNVKKEEKKMN